MSTLRANNLKSLDGVGKANFTVDTIAELRTLTPITGMKVLPAGYYTPGDGGGGPLRVWKTGAVGFYVDNGGSIIVPTGGDGSGAWVWEWSGAVNVKWFGAVGDGVADDTDAFDNILLAEGNIFLSKGTFRVTRALNGNLPSYNIQGASRSETMIKFDAAVTGNYEFRLEGSVTATGVALSASYAVGDKTIAFTGAHGLVVGDVFILANQSDFSYSGHRSYYRQGEMCKVQSVTNSTTVVLESGLYADYNPAVDVITVSRLNPIQVTMQDFTIRHNPSNYGWYIRYTKDTSVLRVNSLGGSRTLFTALECWNLLVSDCTADVLNEPSDIYDYGYIVGQSQHVRLEKLVINTLGDAIETTGGLGNTTFPMRDYVVDNCMALNGAISQHGHNEYTITSNCTVRNGDFVIAGDHCVVTKCFSNGRIGAREERGYDFLIEGCTISINQAMTDSYVSLLRFGDMDSTKAKRGGTIQVLNNIIRDNGFVARCYFNYLTVDNVDVKKINLRFSGNTCDISNIRLQGKDWNRIEFYNNVFTGESLSTAGGLFSKEFYYTGNRSYGRWRVILTQTNLANRPTVVPTTLIYEIKNNTILDASGGQAIILTTPQDIQWSKVFIDGNTINGTIPNSGSTTDVPIYLSGLSKRTDFFVQNNYIGEEIIGSDSRTSRYSLGINGGGDVCNLHEKGNSFDAFKLIAITGTINRWTEEASRRTITSTFMPTAGKWEARDIVWKRTLASGQSIGWVCITTGSFSTMNTTGNSTTGSYVITGVADTTGIQVGDYVTLSGLSVARQIVDAVGPDWIMIQYIANATVTGLTITPALPVFKTFGTIDA